MSVEDDPFGLAGDPGRTRIRPLRPAAADPTTVARHDPFAGGRQRGGDPAAPRSGTPSRSPRTHPNPLVAAQAALLEFAPELERAAPAVPADTLRVRLLDTLVAGRDATVASGAPLARADQAAWFVAALLDDIALNTPWGGHSGWPSQPLVVALSGGVDAGTRFFERLDELMRHPDRDPEMLELAGLCVGLGFRGKHRVQGGAGEAALEALRARITRLLQQDEARGRPLSPHWQGVEAPDEPRRFAVPLWTVGLGAVALLAMLYTGLSLQLSNRSGQLFALSGALPPSERAAIYRPLRENVAPPPAAVQIDPVVMELLPEFARSAPAATIGALKGREDVTLAVLVVQSTEPEVFRSARAELNPVYGPLIASVAAVIAANADVIGRITVLGHTDNVPVQRANPFVSNQGLSEARARTIAGLLTAGGAPAERITAEGRADSEPLADNATREGRAQNRRIEIRIEKRL